MTPLKGTLKNARDFERVRASSRAARRDGVTVHTARSGPGHPTKVGISVGARAGGAVERNRIKRRLRAAAEAALPSEGFEVAVAASATVGSVAFQELVINLRDAALEACPPSEGS